MIKYLIRIQFKKSKELVNYIELDNYNNALTFCKILKGNSVISKTFIIKKEYLTTSKEYSKEEIK